MLESYQMVTSMWDSMASWFTPIYLFCFLNLMIATIYMASTFKIQPLQSDQFSRAPFLLNRVKSINFPFYTSEHNNDQPTISTSLLARAPLVLKRVKSFNYSFFGQENDYPSVPQPQFEEPMNGNNHLSSLEEEEHNSGPSLLARVPTLIERVRTFNFSLYNHPDTFPNQTRVSDPHPGLEPNHHMMRVRSKSAKKSGVIRAKVSAKMKRSASAKGMGHAKWAMEEDVERRRPETVRERKVKKDAETSGDEGGVDSKADDFINMFKQQLKLQRLNSMVRYTEMLGRGT